MGLQVHQRLLTNFKSLVTLTELFLILKYLALESKRNNTPEIPFRKIKRIVCMPINFF